MHEIAALEVEWMQAWVDRDEDAIERILHPQFTLRSIATDDLVDRARWCSDAVGGRIMGTSFDYQEVTITEVGGAAIVDARLSFVGTIDGADWAATTYVTDVWVLESERWRVARRHASREAGRTGEMRA